MALGELPEKDWYIILGAAPSDSLMELKRKYQSLILLYHPDKQSTDVPAGEVEARMQRFIEIDRAWKILGNEETKKEYDLQRRDRELTQGWPVDAQVLIEDMNWNQSEHSYSLACRCGGKYIVSKSEAEDGSVVSCNTCSLLIEILRRPNNLCDLSLQKMQKVQLGGQFVDISTTEYNEK
ncbi:dnaJ homolog subfamily C member 24 [Anolis carolinensis]|uniref:DnaJ homolog subfamily C member 24 n=1 Tax=Anolis carolinensis TaxID=28377 RepID=A0A803TJA5_ANOCA|nr:PREDICTED: dnaJ homolog subfamily C member 24 [Anolis carolinensis]XP_008104662.1 PREDICTED: dnaJ homolog subfamily C member 24 [Anolis carolinensis]XP_016848325.1 PREDICTED: dnaJ homolog subfamily C member 24 [Anolis carolinensis]|eukprot:XP_003214754.1 PREDICTED: dnaJ homolog subfamily C member 24 [Anolis carolinensis]